MGKYKKSQKYTKLFSDVIRSDDFLSLNHADRTIFCYLMTEYNGNNNGSIRCGHKHLKSEYWLKGGSDTHHKALRRLIAAGIVFITRKGGKNIGPDLCALTMFNMDDAKDGEKYRHPYKADIRPLRSHWDKPLGNGNPMHKILSKTASNVTKGRFGK